MRYVVPYQIDVLTEAENPHDADWIADKATDAVVNAGFPVIKSSCGFARTVGKRFGKNYYRNRCVGMWLVEAKDVESATQLGRDITAFVVGLVLTIPRKGDDGICARTRAARPAEGTELTGKANTRESFEAYISGSEVKQ